MKISVSVRRIISKKQGRFVGPYGIATDKEGNVWVSNWGSDTVSVLEVRPEGTPASSPLETTKNIGGIDLNPALLDLQIKRDGNGVPLPLPMQPIQDMHIEGFLPVIQHRPHHQPAAAFRAGLAAARRETGAIDLSGIELSCDFLERTISRSRSGNNSYLIPLPGNLLL